MTCNCMARKRFVFVSTSSYFTNMELLLWTYSTVNMGHSIYHPFFVVSDTMIDLLIFIEFICLHPFFDRQYRLLVIAAIGSSPSVT